MLWRRRYARAELAAELAECGVGVSVSASGAPRGGASAAASGGAPSAASTSAPARVVGGVDPTPAVGWFGWLWGGAREAASGGAGAGGGAGDAGADAVGEGIVLTDAQKEELLRLLADDVIPGGQPSGSSDPTVVIRLWTANVDLVEVGVRSQGSRDTHIRAERLTCTFAERTGSYRVVGCASGGAKFL